MIDYAIMIAVISFFGDGVAKPDQMNVNAAVSDHKATEKPVCRRYADIGSNIARRKICMTKQQWDKMARDSQEVGRSMQPALTTGAQ